MSNLPSFIDQIRNGKRDANHGEMFRRFRSIDAADGEAAADDGTLNLVLSTDDPVDMGGWREVLVHSAGAIDTNACRSLLINHDANQIAGRIDTITCDGKQQSCKCSLMPEARLSSGVLVKDAVKFGALRGVSIGYTYDSRDCTFDEQTRTVTVRRWRLLEGTLTPIPADAAAGVRSMPSVPPTHSNHGDSMNLDQLLAMFPMHRDLVTKLHRDGKKPEEISAAVLALISDSNRAADADAATRAAETATRAEGKKIADLAESVGLKASDYAGMRFNEAQTKMMTDLAARKASGAEPITPVVPTATVTRAAEDKARDAAVGALLFAAGHRSGKVRTDDGEYDVAAQQRSNPLCGAGILDIIRQTAAACGIDAVRMSRKELAYVALGRPEMLRNKRDAANVVVGMFPNFVFLDAMNKALALGFSSTPRSINYQRISKTQTVPDFRQFNIGDMAAGNLTQTVEDAAFPELQYSEGVYSSRLKMWGGTMSLTLQSLVNDDTGQFTQNLAQAGILAQKTINKRVFQKLLMGTSTSEATATWTGNTTSGGSLVYATADACVAARAKLSSVRAALMNKTGLDGNPLGTMASTLVVGPTREVEARGLLGLSPGQQNNQDISMDVLVSPWLEAAALAGNSTTSYYLLADPAEVTGLLVTLLQGMEAPQVLEYDAGAVASRKWKIFLPFEADLVNQTIGGVATIAAAQQGTT